GTVEAEVNREMIETVGIVKPREIATIDERGVEGVTASPSQIYHSSVHTGSVAPMPIVPLLIIQRQHPLWRFISSVLRGAYPEATGSLFPLLHLPPWAS